MIHNRTWLPMLAAAGLLAACTMQPSGTPEEEVATFDTQDTEVAATDRIQFVTNLDGVEPRHGMIGLLACIQPSLHLFT